MLPSAFHTFDKNGSGSGASLCALLPLTSGKDAVMISASLINGDREILRLLHEGVILAWLRKLCVKV